MVRGPTPKGQRRSLQHPGFLDVSTTFVFDPLGRLVPRPAADQSPVQVFFSPTSPPGETPTSVSGMNGQRVAIIWSRSRTGATVVSRHRWTRDHGFMGFVEAVASLAMPKFTVLTAKVLIAIPTSGSVMAETRGSGNMPEPSVTYCVHMIPVAAAGWPDGAPGKFTTSLPVPLLARASRAIP